MRRRPGRPRPCWQRCRRPRAPRSARATPRPAEGTVPRNDGQAWKPARRCPLRPPVHGGTIRRRRQPKASERADADGEKGRVSKAVFVTLRDGTREGSRRRACPTYLGRFPTPSALGRLPLRVPGVHESLPEEAVVQQRWQARHRPRERRGCWRGAATCAVTRAIRRERLSASGAARGGNVPVRAVEARPVGANKQSRARGQL